LGARHCAVARHSSPRAHKHHYASGIDDPAGPPAQSHDFGLVAMVLALVGFAPCLSILGTTDASTQKTRITRVEISTLFWFNLPLALLCRYSL
jgi:hypothetical protein